MEGGNLGLGRQKHRVVAEKAILMLKIATLKLNILRLNILGCTGGELVHPCYRYWL